jgi:hypothetical protein
MKGKALRFLQSRITGWLAGAVLSAAWAATPAAAQTVVPATLDKMTSAETGATTTVDSGIQQTGCSTCGSGLFSNLGGGCSSCGVNFTGSCYPGRFGDKCDDGCGTGFFSSLYNCICCPDPCYEPHWLPVADSAFFLSAARPVTQMDIRFDSGFDMKHPDRAQYFWAQESTVPMQTGAGRVGIGPGVAATRVDHQDLDLYTEAASGHFSAFIQMPYRHVDAETATGGEFTSSNFGDLDIGTKAMLLDCQLTQITFQFTTSVPTGNFTKGEGTGHVSLEPALLFNLCLSPDTYIQGETAYWICISEGGSDNYAGNIFHNHLSLNHVFFRPRTGMQIVGVLEFNEWSVQSGAYTSLVGTTPVASFENSTIVSAGPGVRAFICDKIDFGVGTAFALTGPRWDAELIRAEFRWRF